MKRAFVIGALKSGSGKTTLTLGLVELLKRRGFTVQPFKVGPDYIDTGLLSAISGVPARNLDIWMCGSDYVRTTFRTFGNSADIAIVEGVMGLFDGGESSTAAVAKTLKLPVILVVDVARMAQTVAAIVKGIVEFDRDLQVAGVIFNHAGSPRHAQMIAEAVKAASNIRIIGFMPEAPEIRIPARHLGLHTASENPLSDTALEALVSLLEKNLHIDDLLEITKVQPHCESQQPQWTPNRNLKHDHFIKVAIARDNAFSFYYEDNIDLLKAHGARVEYFSPLDDRCLPEGVALVYLGGGYPELYAAQLCANESMLRSIREFARTGGYVYGECGGFMYLCEAITDDAGKRLLLCGIYPVTAVMRNRKARLGYREITISDACFLGAPGMKLRGHEFHYSETENMPATVRRVFDSPDNTEGYAIGNVIASYVHVHFASNPLILDHTISYIARNK